MARRRWLLGVLVAGVIIGGACYLVAREDVHHASLITPEQAIALAAERATRLGYDVPTMDAVARRRGRSYVIEFRPETPQFGGNVVIQVESSRGTILDVQSGQ